MYVREGSIQKIEEKLCKLDGSNRLQKGGGFEVV